jgi:hypothetical protein
LDLKCPKPKLYYVWQSVCQSVLLSRSHDQFFFFLKLSLESCRIVDVEDMAIA